MSALICSVCGGECKWVGAHTQCQKCESIGTVECPEDYRDEDDGTPPESEGGEVD